MEGGPIMLYVRNLAVYNRKFQGVNYPCLVVKKPMLRCLYEWMASLGSIPSCQFFDYRLLLMN